MAPRETGPQHQPVEAIIFDGVMPGMGETVLKSAPDLIRVQILLLAKQLGRKAKAVTLNYGLFINAIVNFLIVAFVLFMFLRQLNKLVAPPATAEAAPPPSEEVLLFGSKRRDNRIHRGDRHRRT